MQEERLQKQITFIKEIDKLKLILRKTKLICTDRNENDAEHSWHLAMMTIILAEHSNTTIDVLKVLKMVLIHDIVEIDTGDIFYFDADQSHSNFDKEFLAAKRIFGLLPEDQAEEFIAIWREFEEGESKEAKFARSVDRFEPVLQNTSNHGGTWAEFNLSYPTIHNKLQVIEKGSIAIWDFAKKLISETLKKGYIKN